MNSKYLKFSDMMEELELIEFEQIEAMISEEEKIVQMQKGK